MQLLLPLQDKPLLAGDVLRSSILKEPISSGGGSAKAVAGFAGTLPFLGGLQSFTPIHFLLCQATGQVMTRPFILQSAAWKSKGVLG